MLKRKNYYQLIIVSFIFYFSCGSDDAYIPLSVNAVDDIYQVAQNNSIEMDVLSNDINVPTQGTLSVSNSQNGTLEILSNTPSDPSDDIIKYTPFSGFNGNDSFSYTICSSSNCSTSIVTLSVFAVSNVNFNLEEVPYPTLSAYNFFEGELKDLNPVSGVLPFDLNSSLFSDYARKKRFVWMPTGVKATYTNDYSSLDFPIGAVLIKNFYFENVLPDNSTKILETRLMYKTNEGWAFATYIWNETQSEAVFTNSGSVVNLQWSENNATKTVNYRIPSPTECFTCHNKFGTPLPIGPKPQNLNKSYTYSDGPNNQLSKWINEDYLQDNLPLEIVSTIAWDDNSKPLEQRVRSYLDINCAHCHSNQSYCEYRPMRFAFAENDDDTNIGVCVTPDTQIEPFTKIIVPGNTASSLLVFRLSSIQEQYRMPLLGRTLKHDEGVRLIEEWINTLNYECD